jgi:hypothetical protein
MRRVWLPKAVAAEFMLVVPKNYPGSFERHGVVVSDVVGAHFFGASIRLHDNVQAYARLKTGLRLAPFGVEVLTQAVLKPALGKTSYTLQDREWEVAGRHLGELEYGPLGDPRDGEFEIRPVHAFRAMMTYSRQKLSLEFLGRTESGFEVCHAGGTVERLDLAPWEFTVRFDVERKGLQEFLQLPQNHLDSFLARLDAL